jgi:hypothetical protein
VLFITVQRVGDRQDSVVYNRGSETDRIVLFITVQRAGDRQEDAVHNCSTLVPCYEANRSMLAIL